MNTKTRFSLGALAAGLGLCLGFSSPPAAEVSLGDSVSYEFRSPVVNGMGMTSLSDLAGKPVLVEFWGTR